MCFVLEKCIKAKSILNSKSIYSISMNAGTVGQEWSY